MKLQPSFSRQPYQQLEAVLREAGPTGAADDVAIARRDAERDELELPGHIIRYAVTQLHRTTVFYGYQPELSIVWLAVLLGLGWWFAGRIPNSYREKNGVRSRWYFSFDRLIPFVELHKPDQELDLTNGAVPYWVRWYFTFQTLAGYVLAAFLLTAIARVLV